MRILGLDLETTGLDTSTSLITELGVVLWEVETKRPVMTVGVFLHDDTYPKQTEEIIRITGITDDMLAEFGTDPAQNLRWLEGFCAKHKVEYLCAHNGENFDKPLLMANLTRYGVEAPTLRGLQWIDTRVDIPFASEPDSRKLKHLALDIGVINHFPHRAITDVLTMMLVLAHYDINAVLEYQKIPFITMRADVDFQRKELAKAQRYSWEKIGEKTYPKQWVKRIKENLLQQELEACQKGGFTPIRIE